MTSGISRDEWLKALGDAVAPADPDALTVPELMQMFGLGRDAMRTRVSALVKAGKAVRTVKNQRTTAGYMQRVPAYKLKTKR